MSKPNGRVAVLMPSRGDPELLQHSLQTAADTQGGFADFFVRIAEDDPKLDEYRRLAASRPHPWVHFLFGDPLGFSRGVNELAQRAMDWDEYSLLMRGEDDFEYQGESWDTCYLKTATDRFPDGVGMVWCNYVLKGPGAEPQTAAIGHGWYRALGWFSLPTVKHYYCDNVIGDLASAIGRRNYIDLPLIKHNWISKPAYVEMGPDERAYREYHTSGHIHNDVKRLKTWIELGGEA